ncbi:MAG: VCBS repeat-containing protein, partial [Flavobacteriales bacterium]|nr:VCBS repeat-containing protein [Flavobacteriales bacterium]
TGQGPPKSIVIDLFKSSTGTYDEDIFSRIDASSFQYKINNGAFQSISPSSTFSTQNNGDYSCLGSNPIGRVLLDLPNLAVSENLTLTWDIYHCGINVCLNQKVMGWEYELNYKDTCDYNSYNSTGTGESNNIDKLSLFTETPSDINHGESEIFTYTISSFSNDLPVGTGAHYELIFTLPVGLMYNSGLNDLTFHSGPTTWQAFQTTYNSQEHSITAKYALPEPFSIPKSEINLILSGDCTQIGANDGTVEIELDINYISDSTCSPGYKIPFACDYKVDVDLHCPPIGQCEGMRFESYEINRTSFGSPDNDQNGLADASGSINPQNIKENRVMVGDTLLALFKGVVDTSTSHPQWLYGYASTLIELGSNLSSISASITIYDASSSQYINCNQVAITSQVTGNNQTFYYDFSPTSLSSNCSNLVGFQFQSGDSIWLTTEYKVTGNIGGNVQEVKASNEFYLSNTANPSLAQDKYQCGIYNDKFTLIGYYFTNSWVNNYTIKKCTKVISQSFWLSIGDCCSNYDGGDLFPFEYRNWANVKMARVTIPSDYVVLNSYVRQRRTLYVNSSATQLVDSITALSNTNNTLVFDLEQHYIPNGGSIYLSDDGFQGTLYLEIAPTCDVPNNTFQDIDWEFSFKKADFIGGGDTDWYTSNPDRIRFNPTNLVLSSTNPIIDGLEKTITWNLNVKNNTGNSDATSSWLHLKTPSGELEIVKIEEVSSGGTLSQVSDIYQIGDINRSQSKDFKITARYNSCSVDLIWVYAGYECSGYPSSFSSFKCSYSQMELRVEPKPAGIQAIMDGVTIGGECNNTVEVTIEVASVKLANADSIEVHFSLPSNNSLSYNNGSSKFKYPLANNFSSINDPDFEDSKFKFKTVNHSSAILNYGVPGVLNLDSNKFQVKFQLNIENNFIPGDYVAISIIGQEVCGKQLQSINMAYDPSVKFEKNQTSGLSTDSDNNWSIVWVDYNNDGWEDVFVTNYTANQPNALYKNNSDGSFTKTTNAGSLTSDLTNSVPSTWADYDNDGDIDVFVANNTGSTNFLYDNNGDESFTRNDLNLVSQYGGYCHNASWADFDNDGFLDLFVSEYMPTKFNLLYRNLGNGSFILTSGNPISEEASYSIGATWGDYDNDGDLDLFVPNTNNSPNSLYSNEGDGKFNRITTGEIVTDSTNSVGSSWGDYDNDGDLDLFVANSGNQNNCLYQNNGDGTFTKITTGIVVNDGGHSHGSSWADFDNDGDLDLLVTNDQDNANRLYTNNKDGSFSLFDNAINSDMANSFGAAWGDYDNDGDLDVLIGTRDNTTDIFLENVRGSCLGN